MADANITATKGRRQRAAPPITTDGLGCWMIANGASLNGHSRCLKKAPSIAPKQCAALEQFANICDCV